MTTQSRGVIRAVLVGCVTLGAVSAAVAQVPTDEALNLPSVDRAFVGQTARSGKMEIELSKLAAVNAGDERVKRYAQRMLEDRTKIDGELAQAEKDAGSLELKPYQRATLDWIAQLRGAAFDREYMQLAILDERSMRDECAAEAESGQVPALKAIAQRALPTLQSDLVFGDRARMEMVSPSSS